MTGPKIARGGLALALALACAGGPAGAAVAIPGFELVHTSPVETTLATPDIRDPVTVWCQMIDGARNSLDFEQYYVAGKAGSRLDRVIASLEAAGRRGVKIRFLMEEKGLGASDQETIDRLKRIPNLTFRLLAFAKMEGDGIIHAKFFTVDRRTAYVGSQNFDWRSLEHIDETGLKVEETRMVGQMQAIFEHDWQAQALIEQGQAVPPLRSGDDAADAARPAYLLASPNRFDPPGVGDSQAALPRLIGAARHDVRIEVMEYAAIARDGGPYAVIDDALRAAAARGVKVRLLVADWDLTQNRIPSLRSLAAVPGVEIRVTRIPQAAAGPIPYSRVIHTKIMTVDGRTAWIGTSNWEGGYLDHSRNLEVVLQNRKMTARLQQLHERTWSSSYTRGLEEAITAWQVPPKP